MILISNDFWNKIIMYNFDPYNVLLAIATNIAVLFMTDFVLQFFINFSENKTNILSQFCFSSRCILFQEHFDIFNGNKTKILNRAFTQLHNFDSVCCFRSNRKQWWRDRKWPPQLWSRRKRRVMW